MVGMIQGYIHTDDYEHEAHFDAEPWFRRASDEQIEALADIDWGGNYPADDVAWWMRGKDEDWYERDDLCSDHDVEASEPIQSYVYRPRRGSSGVSLEPGERAQEMEQRLSYKKLKAKLLR